MHPNQKIKFNDWYMKIDPPMWMAADFECVNVPVASNKNNSMDKMFLNKPVGIGYNTVNNLDYANLYLEKDGYIKYFGEDCVEWFLYEILEIEDYMKSCFKN